VEFFGVRGRSGKKREVVALKPSVASYIFTLAFRFFRGIAKRFPLFLLMGQPS
jgi:hypothetical protein